MTRLATPYPWLQQKEAENKEVIENILAQCLNSGELEQRLVKELEGGNSMLKDYLSHPHIQYVLRSVPVENYKNNILSAAIRGGQLELVKELVEYPVFHSHKAYKNKSGHSYVALAASLFNSPQLENWLIEHKFYDKGQLQAELDSELILSDTNYVELIKDGLTVPLLFLFNTSRPWAFINMLKKEPALLLNDPNMWLELKDASTGWIDEVGWDGKIPYYSNEIFPLVVACLRAYQDHKDMEKFNELKSLVLHNFINIETPEEAGHAVRLYEQSCRTPEETKELWAALSAVSHSWAIPYHKKHLDLQIEAASTPTGRPTHKL